MDLSYVFFDTLSTGTAAFDTLLFQVAQGGDSTHTEDYTNSKGAGSFPAGQKFTVKKISVAFDPAITPADLSKIAIGSFIQLRVNDQVLFWSPLSYVFGKSGYQGFSNQAAAATLAAAGVISEGFDFETPVEIAGGVSFAVRIKTTQATAASTKLVCSMRGVFTMP